MGYYDKMGSAQRDRLVKLFEDWRNGLMSKDKYIKKFKEIID